jgi:hypothetical protein
MSELPGQALGSLLAQLRSEETALPVVQSGSTVPSKKYSRTISEFAVSAYGLLWQQVFDIRARLRALFPEANVDSLAEARQSTADILARTAAPEGIPAVTQDVLDRIACKTLLDWWAELEVEMARCNEEGGLP